MDELNDHLVEQSGPDWAAGPPVPAALLEVLRESRRRGLIGPTDLDQQVVHAHGFISCMPSASRILDLGSGGGLPGLVLAIGRPDLELALLDASARRIRLLEWAVKTLDCEDRVDVIHHRAEEAGRLGELRERFDGVVARSFGPPAVTAECGRPFLAKGGSMVISEPPDSHRSHANSERWPVSGLENLGLRPERIDSNGFSFVRLEAVEACSDEFPRRTGMPAKRPLF